MTYCVLRNHEGLPYRNVATDIDLLISGSDRQQALRCFESIDGAVLTGKVRRAAATHLFLDGVRWDGHRAIEVDVMTAVVWKGVPYVGTDHVLARARPAGPDRTLVRIPHVVDEAVVSLLSTLLAGERIKERYQDGVRSVFAARPGEAAAVLAPSFGADLAGGLVESVAADRRADAIAMVPALRRALLVGSLRSRPRATARRMAAHYRREAEIRWTPRYVADVCLVGGDTGSRVAFARELAAAVTHMAKDVRVVEPRDRGPLARRLAYLVPDVRNRAVRLWTDMPAEVGASRGLVLAIGPRGTSAAVPAVELPADRAERLEVARTAVRDHLASSATAAGRAAP